MRETPIYEVLKPKECFILVRRDDEFLVASNTDGTIVLNWVELARWEEPKEIVCSSLHFTL